MIFHTYLFIFYLACHAYLFSGPRGSGKTTVARLFAKAINCEKLVDSEPCNKCDSCKEIMGSNSMDLMEIDAASHGLVDEVRELIDGIRFSPVKSKYKIFIIALRIKYRCDVHTHRVFGFR